MPPTSGTSLPSPRPFTAIARSAIELCSHVTLNTSDHYYHGISARHLQPDYNIAETRETKCWS